MEVIGRILQLSQYLSRGMGKTFSAHGLNGAKFDVLATIRRSGAPYGLSPNDLINLLKLVLSNVYQIRKMQEVLSRR
ncbi:hypothetical protein MNBD_GAMMA16-1602 [hydrothermal vent metagenome]|uniref:Uncharacterized protein n=1 Tax=hydrothermal vent metagenome TaxID=652676 RepID=A0A3B0ZAJ0_9ZZZZ